MEAVQTDHGSQFWTDKWVNKLKKANIRTIPSSVRHAQSNIVERSMKELAKFFRVMVQHKHTAWPSYIEIIQNIINEVYQETTGFTPMEIHLGKRPT